MMREIRTLLMGAALLVGTLAFAPVLSQADENSPTEDNPYARNGFYVGLAGSFAVDMAAEDELEKQLDLGLKIDERFGLNARLGYRFHPHISAELQLEWIPEVDISTNPQPDPNFGNDAFSLERVTYMANAKGYLGTGTLQPFLLVGVGLMTIDFKGNKPFNNISSTEEDFAARFGGGIEVYATDNIVINIDASYVLPAGDLKNFDYLSIGWGFQYRF